MNKLTDAEILKALECCGNIVDSTCKECAYHKTYNASCVVRLMRDDLDLINWYKAEVERLKHRKTELQIRNQELQHEKSEAIKEFAEEFEYFVLNEDIEVVEPKCKDYESYINGANQFRHQIKNGINNLVKEMMEVNENE